MRALLFFLPMAAYGAACTATTGCTEWITFNGGPARSMIYRTYPLTVKNENIKRAFILVHGAGPDADNYYRTALAAAFLAGAPDAVLLPSTRFASNSGTPNGCQDTLAPNEVNWSCN